jgi:hypothetical protein
MRGAKVDAWTRSACSKSIAGNSLYYNLVCMFDRYGIDIASSVRQVGMLYTRNCVTQR